MAGILLGLPNELLLTVADHVHELRHLNAFAQTSRQLYHLLNCMLYARDVRKSQGLALHWAAKQGLKQTAHLSFAEGARIQSIDPPPPLRNRTPRIANKDYSANLTLLQIALVHKHEDVARLLVENGAHITRAYPKPLSKFTPLHIASALGLVATVRLLVEQGAELEARDSSSQTALHYAVKPRRYHPRTQANVEIVTLLLESGGVYTTKDNNGRTAEDLINLGMSLLWNASHRKGLTTVADYPGLEHIVPTGCHWTKGMKQEDCSAETEIKRILEAKRAVWTVEKWHTDRQLQREKARDKEAALKATAIKDRERLNPQWRDRAVREANRIEAERQIVEAAKIEAAEVEAVRKETERLHLAETDRAERQTAIRMEWSRLRERAEQTTIKVSSGSATVERDCCHPSGRLKSKGRGQCERCERICRQYSYKCPDCEAVVCAQCL